MRTSLSAAAGAIIALGICAGAASVSALTLPNLPASIIQSGNGGTALVTGNNTINTVTVPCVNATGCQLLTLNMVAVDLDAGNWKICTFVDGVQAGQCPDQGRKGSGTMTITGTGQATAILTHGPHTVQTVVEVPRAATLDSWQVNYLRFAIFPMHR